MKRICIIGGGIGGLLTGSLLARRGHEVEVFEREEKVGGRALSLNMDELDAEEYERILSRFNMDIYHAEPGIEEMFEKGLLKGYKLDLGFHAIGGGEKAINKSLSGIGKVEMIETRLAYIKERGFDYPFLPTKDRLKILPQILHLILSGEKTMEKLDKVPMSDTIERYGKGKMRLILELFSRVITTVNDLNRISTGETLRSLKLLLKGSSPVGYPKGGLRALYVEALNFLRRGGKIHLNTPVREIVVEGSRVKRVLADKEREFDVVISNLLIRDLLKVLKGDVPERYIESLKSLSGTGGLCAYHSLKKIDPSLLGKTFLFIERDVGIEGNDAVGMIDFMTCLEESALSPKNNYLIQSYIICTPEEARNKRVLEKLKETLEGNIKKLIPDLEAKMNWELYLPIWHLDGVAKTIENEKPDIKTPIENLFLVGDCTKAPGIGINCSLNSANELYELLVSQL